MPKLDAIRELFDEKLLNILNAFLEEEKGEPLSLSEISSKSKVNITTTSRIIEKLIHRDIIEPVSLGKFKSYRLKKNERTLELSRIIKKEEHFSDFLDFLQKSPNIKALILDTKTSTRAKIIVVGENIPSPQINSKIELIKRENGFKIDVLELTTAQFKKVKSMDLFNINSKILWEK